MQLRIERDDGVWVGELSEAVDLSRPVQLGGGVSAFGLGHATARPVDIGGGRRLATTEGGSVNCFDVTWNAHGHGTHTESLAHITNDGPSIDAVAPIGWLIARFVRIVPVALGRSAESYAGKHEPNDRVIAAAALMAAVGDLTSIDAVVIATEPYDRLEGTDYSSENPPYLSAEAAAFLATSGIAHIVVDVPSVDREDDGGTTPNHRAFWGLPLDTRNAADATHPARTVTELAQVPETLAPGLIALSLQVAPIASDAAPSRPVAVPLMPLSSPPGVVASEPG